MKASPPASHERVTVDERDLGQLLHRGCVIIGVALDEDDPEVVVPAEVGDALVDVFGMEEVIADPEEEDTGQRTEQSVGRARKGPDMSPREVEHSGGGADLVVAFDVAVLPRDLTDVADDGVPFLFGEVEGANMRRQRYISLDHPEWRARALDEPGGCLRGSSSRLSA